MAVKRSIENMFDMPAGIYCGVLMRERLMKRYLKLQNEYDRKIKELLTSNLDELELMDWTLNDNEEETGKQVEGNYFFINTTDQEKLDRIELFTLNKARKCELLYEVNNDDIVDGREEVTKELNKIALEDDE